MVIRNKGKGRMSVNQVERLNQILFKPEQGKIYQYKHLIFFSMCCMMLMLCKSVFSYRLVALGGFTLQAGQLIAPLWFTISDISAEVYGYKVARKILSTGLICQVIFTIICMILINLPHPSFWHDEASFKIVFGDMWRVSFAVLFAFFVSGLINIKLISYLKVLMHGEHFWLRSICASGISEILYSILATFIIQYGKLNLSVIFSIIIASATLKIIYSILLAFPAHATVFFVSRSERQPDEKLSF